MTDDLGFFDDSGYLHIVGRNSRKIIPGGENIYPPEIEAAILAINLVKDVCVVGVADEKWGEAVTALCVLRDANTKLATIQEQHINFDLETKSVQDANTKLATIQEQLRSQLSRYKQPKNWLCMPSLPRNSQGKLNYSEIKKIAANLLRDSQQQV